MASLSSLCVQWRIHGHGPRGSELRKAISTLDLTLQPEEVGSRQKLINSSVLLKACIRSGNLELGKLLHHKLIHSGLPLDSVLLNSLISLYSKCGDWQSALSIFQMDWLQMSVWVVLWWTCMLNVQQMDHKKILGKYLIACLFIMLCLGLLSSLDMYRAEKNKKP